MQINNAVIPVAGLGLRLLPATKSQPKEMLPVGRKPVVQYVVEELAHAGVRNVLFVTGRSKTSIEDHFDRDAELRRALSSPARADLRDSIAFESLRLRYHYTRQSRAKGLGDAIGHAEHFAGDEPFIAALGDSILWPPQGDSALRRMIDCYDKSKASCVIAFETVARKDTFRYGIADPLERGPVFQVKDLVEKPPVAEAPSNLAIAARYIFSPNIFDAIRKTRRGAGGEIQITDAIRLLIRQGERVFGVSLGEGQRRYDIGNYESYFKAFIDFALADPDCGDAVKKYLKNKLAGR